MAADEENFAHDVGGIRRHLNRETLELEDGFSPRFSTKCWLTKLDEAKPFRASGLGRPC